MAPRNFLEFIAGGNLPRRPLRITIPDSAPPIEVPVPDNILSLPSLLESQEPNSQAATKNCRQSRSDTSSSRESSGSGNSETETDNSDESPKKCKCKKVRFDRETIEKDDNKTKKEEIKNKKEEGNRKSACWGKACTHFRSQAENDESDHKSSKEVEGQENANKIKNNHNQGTQRRNKDQLQSQVTSEKGNKLMGNKLRPDGQQKRALWDKNNYNNASSHPQHQTEGNILQYQRYQKARLTQSQLISQYYRLAMSRLLKEARADVVIREDVIENPALDPAPNAFYDAKTGILRVYHGPAWGNATASLLPMTAQLGNAPHMNGISTMNPMMQNMSLGLGHNGSMGPMAASMANPYFEMGSMGGTAGLGPYGQVPQMGPIGNPYAGMGGLGAVGGAGIGMPPYGIPAPNGYQPPPWPYPAYGPPVTDQNGHIGGKNKASENEGSDSQDSKDRDSDQKDSVSRYRERRPRHSREPNNHHNHGNVGGGEEKGKQKNRERKQKGSKNHSEKDADDGTGGWGSSANNQNYSGDNDSYKNESNDNDWTKSKDSDKPLLDIWGDSIESEDQCSETKADDGGGWADGGSSWDTSNDKDKVENEDVDKARSSAEEKDIWGEVIKEKDNNSSWNDATGTNLSTGSWGEGKGPITESSKKDNERGRGKGKEKDQGGWNDSGAGGDGAWGNKDAASSTKGWNSDDRESAAQKTTW